MKLERLPSRRSPARESHAFVLSAWSPGDRVTGGAGPGVHRLKPAASLDWARSNWGCPPSLSLKHRGPRPVSRGCLGAQGWGSVLKGASGLCSAPWGGAGRQAWPSGRSPAPVDPGQPGPCSEVGSAWHTPLGGLCGLTHTVGIIPIPASHGLLFYRKEQKCP